jgi:asparagine synthase (glutamine-hydrolysing)
VERLSDLQFPDGGWNSWKLHTYLFEAKDFPRYLKESIDILVEPTRQSGMPLYLKMAQIAADAGVKAVLLGEGADELFLGYKSYLPLLDRKDLFSLYAQADQRDMLCEILGANFFSDTEDELVRILGNLNEDDFWSKLRRVELENGLAPLLYRADKILMRHSIEGRTPFLHGGIPDHASALSVEHLLASGQTKIALRTAFSDCLPDYYQSEVKKPFRSPLTVWFSGQLADWVKREITRGKPIYVQMGFATTKLETLIQLANQGDALASDVCFRFLTLLYWVERLEELGAELIY